MEWITAAAAGAAVDSLDLGRLVRRLVAEDGLGSAASANAAIAEYKRFLLDAAARPDTPLAPPSAEADAVWQRHLLDTERYHADCERIFGVARYAHRIYEDGGGISLSVRTVLPPSAPADGLCKLFVN